MVVEGTAGKVEVAVAALVAGTVKRVTGSGTELPWKLDAKCVNSFSLTMYSEPGRVRVTSDKHWLYPAL